MKLSYVSAAALCVLYLPFAVILGALPSESRAQSFQIDSGISGSWYDPAKEGQGFTIATVNNDLALLTWFTYDQNGSQHWMQGIGNIQGNQAVAAYGAPAPDGFGYFQDVGPLATIGGADRCGFPQGPYLVLTNDPGHAMLATGIAGLS